MLPQLRIWEIASTHFHCDGPVDVNQNIRLICRSLSNETAVMLQGYKYVYLNCHIISSSIKHDNYKANVEMDMKLYLHV